MEGGADERTTGREAAFELVGVASGDRDGRAGSARGRRGGRRPAAGRQREPGRQDRPAVGGRGQWQDRDLRPRRLRQSQADLVGRQPGGHLGPAFGRQRESGRQDRLRLGQLPGRGQAGDAGPRRRRQPQGHLLGRPAGRGSAPAAGRQRRPGREDRPGFGRPLGQWQGAHRGPRRRRQPQAHLVAGLRRRRDGFAAGRQRRSGRQGESALGGRARRRPSGDPRSGRRRQPQAHLLAGVRRRRHHHASGRQRQPGRQGRPPLRPPIPASAG